jgi:RNA polymerase sigma factor (sigma-70 family)
MPATSLGELVFYLRRLSASRHERDLSDGELLGRFLSSGHEHAFATLVQRHGPMVHGVCRRVLGDGHGAEDAFQATFLVLVRRAASIDRTGPLGGWLFGVAERVARRARSQNATRRCKEREAAAMVKPEAIDAPTWKEVRRVLDEEIAALPEKLRLPIVLCYLEGKSYDQAGLELRWPKSTVAKRLARGREELRQRLTRRGISLSAGAMVTVLAAKANTTAIGAGLTINTVRAVISFAGGRQSGATYLSATAVRLAEEAIRATIGIKAALAAVTLGVGLFVGAVSWAAPSTTTENGPRHEAEPMAANPVKQAPAIVQPRLDAFGDPLPEGALARLGTVRFRHGIGPSWLAYSPDGKMLASASRQFGPGVCLWDAVTGRPLRQSHSPLANTLAFSPDGKTLFISNALSLVDVATGNEIGRLEKPIGTFELVAFSSDGRTVAAADLGGGAGVILWDIVTGKELHRLLGGGNFPFAIAFSPDGKTLATCRDEKGEPIRLWDVATGNPVRQLDAQAGALAFAANGKILASSGDDGKVRLWDLETGKILHLLDGKALFVGTVAFSPDAKLIASAQESGLVRLWDTRTGKEVRCWTASAQHIKTVAFSPDGTTIATCGFWDHAIRLWDAATGKEINPGSGHSGSIWSLRFAPDGRSLSSGSMDRKVLRWGVSMPAQHEPVVSSHLEPGKSGWRWSPRDLSQDGKLVVFDGSSLVRENVNEYAIRVCETSTGKEVMEIAGTKLQLHTPRFSPDAKVVASSDADGVHLWEVPTGTQRHFIRDAISVGFSQDGKVLAVAYADGSVRLLDSATFKERRRWDTEQAKPFIGPFSPDGRSVTSYDSDGKSHRTWATDSGKLLTHVNGRKMGGQGVWSTAYTPSGRVLALAIDGRRMLANGSTERTFSVCLYEAISGQEIRQFDVPQGHVFSMAFSPEGRILATGGGDSTILLWDMTGADAGKRPPLAPEEMLRLWAEMAGDAGNAERAIWTLVRAPGHAIPFLMDKLRPVPPGDAEAIGKRIAELASDNFPTRQVASRVLEEMGEAAEAVLRKALQGKLPLEGQRRVELLLQTREKDMLRTFRALDVLDAIGTEEARAVLEMIAKGSANGRLTEAARAAVSRIEARMAAKK